MGREEAYWQALCARDARFDGKFFVGVRTTGIYCRPICPARPRRENVEFFASALRAERAGYRPCLRCRPESAPHSPAWIGKSAIVRRALRRLQIPEVAASAMNEDEFARPFGVSARHLRRLFVDELGKTPRQIAEEGRLNLARTLLVETRLPVSEIAFAAGFGSLRRFNAAFRDRFARRPREIRRVGGNLARGADAVGAPLRLALSYRPPFDFDGLLFFYRAHRVGELEWFEGARMHRIFSLGGRLGELSVTDDPARSRLLLDLEVPDVSLIGPVVARVRAMFDLDSDPAIVANAIERDRGLAKLARARPGTRLPSGWDAFEIGVTTILGQLVSVECGRALVTRLIELLGEDSGRRRDGREIRLFPTPERIAASDLRELGTPAARRRALVGFARAVACGELSLDPAQDVDEFTARALAIPGIGPWTASYLALKALRHTDAFPATDLILKRALELHPHEAIEATRPWRGYAATLLWLEYSSKLRRIPKKGNP